MSGAIETLPTPCLLLDRAKLRANTRRMRDRAEVLGVALRPHLKTAKSFAVLQETLPDGRACGTVSTLEEAEYFLAHGVTDLTYAVGITHDKIEMVAALVSRGARLRVITDDLDVARALGARATVIPTFIEIDSGQHRGGVDPDSEHLIEIARALGAARHGVLTHAGHSYACRSVEAIRAIAEDERAAATHAARRIREAGMTLEHVSVGSTPTALHASHLDGVTELRAGIYVFFDRFQQAVHSCEADDIALSVLTSVIGRRSEEGALWVDAGTLALSSEQSLLGFGDASYGEAIALDGSALSGTARVDTLNQVHGRVTGATREVLDAHRVGSRLRILPNHACITAAMFDRYYVMEDGLHVDTWTRLRG